jgi:hypothetical protein
MQLDEYLKILNETGFFLQMRVAKEVRDANYDLVKEEIAFEHGGQTAKLDVLAEISYILGKDTSERSCSSKRRGICLTIAHGYSSSLRFIEVLNHHTSLGWESFVMALV